tara:strand:+ start:1319 stop:1660 length:342 start_codon:yes stop_codon:yes gene_type:complete
MSDKPDILFYAIVTPNRRRYAYTFEVVPVIRETAKCWFVLSKWYGDTVEHRMDTPIEYVKFSEREFADAVCADLNAIRDKYDAKIKELNDERDSDYQRVMNLYGTDHVKRGSH